MVALLGDYLPIPSMTGAWKPYGRKPVKVRYIIIYFYGLAKRFIGTISLIDFPLLVGVGGRFLPSGQGTGAGRQGEVMFSGQSDAFNWRCSAGENGTFSRTRGKSC